jgi:hypothetical protein
MTMPIVVLKSGVKVGNFSSPHPFRFDDGTVLEACDPERCKAGALESREVEHPTPLGTIDIELQFSMSPECQRMLDESADTDADIIIVPFPVLDCLKRESKPLGKCRVIRMVDRVNKIASSTRFCV